MSDNVMLGFCDRKQEDAIHRVSTGGDGVVVRNGLCPDRRHRFPN